jgi:hypothetical protein
MTPARLAALQWFYDRGAVINALAKPGSPSANMLNQMQNDGQLAMSIEGFVLTDKGRQDLWENRT